MLNGIESQEQIEGAPNRGAFDLGSKQVYENGSIQPYGIEKISQADANYNPYGFIDQQGCATCRWFYSSDNRCHVVNGAIVATGMSDLYLPLRPEDQMAELMADFADAVGDGSVEIEAEAEKQHKPGLLDRLLRRKKQQPEPELFPTDTGFKVIRDADGQDMWIAWYTNPYQDRDGEWFAEKAIDADIAYMNDTGDYPELWFYHMRGTAHGKAISVAKAGRFAVAVGYFDDSDTADQFKAYYGEKTLQLSHGFYYSEEDRRDRTYYKYHTFEISPLPPEAAANPYTAFKLGAKDMQSFTEKQKAALVDVLGEAKAAQIIEQGEKMTSVLDQKVAHKSADDTPAFSADTLAILGALNAMTDSVKALAEKMDSKPAKADKEDAVDDEEDTDTKEKPQKKAADRPSEEAIKAVMSELLADRFQNYEQQVEQRQAVKSGGDALFEMLLSEK